jgi:fumarate reductase subunit C
MATRHTYVRPMDGWWRRDPFFLRYMAREATAPFVAAYALILLVGLVRLAQGQGPFEQWLEALRAPGFVALHGALAAIFVYHTITWFQIMPKTLPPITIRGRRLSATAITVAGLAASAVLSAAVWFLAMAASR